MEPARVVPANGRVEEIPDGTRGNPLNGHARRRYYRDSKCEAQEQNFLLVHCNAKAFAKVLSLPRPKRHVFRCWRARGVPPLRRIAILDNNRRNESLRKLREVKHPAVELKFSATLRSRLLWHVCGDRSCCGARTFLATAAGAHCAECYQVRSAVATGFAKHCRAAWLRLRG